jgi:hypothetical protein
VRPLHGMPVSEVTRRDVCSTQHRTFPSGCRSFTPSLESMLRLASVPFRGTPSGAIRRVMRSPYLSACRHWLLASACARCRVGPLLREGDWITLDGNGVATFRIGRLRRARWPLDSGNGAPSQSARKHRLTTVPIRTRPPPASRCASRRFNQGFTAVQLDTDCSWHKVQRWLPPICLH